MLSTGNDEMKAVPANSHITFYPSLKTSQVGFFGLRSYKSLSHLIRGFKEGIFIIQ